MNTTLLICSDKSEKSASINVYFNAKQSVKAEFYSSTFYLFKDGSIWMHPPVLRAKQLYIYINSPTKLSSELVESIYKHPPYVE